jgi:hypothetical protein
MVHQKHHGSNAHDYRIEALTLTEISSQPLSYNEVKLQIEILNEQCVC